MFIELENNGTGKIEGVCVNSIRRIVPDTENLTQVHFNGGKFYAYKIAHKDLLKKLNDITGPQTFLTSTLESTSKESFAEVQEKIFDPVAERNSALVKECAILVDVITTGHLVVTGYSYDSLVNLGHRLNGVDTDEDIPEEEPEDN